jgi:hypothetical protein
MAKRKLWVLDTETKGTGAQMVPLEQVERAPAEGAEPLWVPPKPRPREPAPPEPRAPRRFRVLDVATREVLADGASARATLAVLAGVRSSVDVTIYVWEPADEDWRLLTMAEQRALWDRRAVS